MPQKLGILRSLYTTAFSDQITVESRPALPSTEDEFDKFVTSGIFTSAELVKDNKMEPTMKFILE